MDGSCNLELNELNILQNEFEYQYIKILEKLDILEKKFDFLK
jgi:hypothetical protein